MRHMITYMKIIILFLLSTLFVLGTSQNYTTWLVDNNYLLPTANYEQVEIDGQIIIYEDGVTQEDINKCREVINKAVAYDRDAIIVLTSSSCERYHSYLNRDYQYEKEWVIGGYTVIEAGPNNENIIIQPARWIETVLLHEIGHCVDTKYHLSQNEQFLEIYSKVEPTCPDNSSNTEYFASSYSNWIRDRLEDEELIDWFEVVFSSSILNM